MASERQSAAVRKPEILEHYYQVIIEKGIEGASIGKIAQRMGIHPSLIIHYFKTKENMTIELLDVLIDKYEAREYLNFEHIKDPEERFHQLMHTTFSFEWSRTVDPGVHFCFYYMSFRNPEIRGRFRDMIKRFRNYLVQELTAFQESGVIQVPDVRVAADYIVTLMEGLEFHAHFLADNEPFDHFAHTARNAAVAYLKNGLPSTM
jgi:AcrR family transcriptional regulator